MKKRHWLIVGAVSLLGLGGMQLAGAEPVQPGGMGPGSGYHRQYAGDPQALDSETLKAREKFLAETTELRKKLATAGAELEALMAQTDPNEKKVADLTGEVFDLREQLRQKAAATGLPGQFGFWCRSGMPGAGMGGFGGRGGRHCRW